jgi:hypothetical protein
LTSSKPIAIVVPGNSDYAEHYESIALRIAHNLYTYLKLDCTILRDYELSANSLEEQSVVVIGGYDNKYGVAIRTSPLEVSLDGAISISGVRYNEPGTAALSLHKVSTRRQVHLYAFGLLLTRIQRHLFMDALDEGGYERALRMFPLRTGVPGPEWLVVGEECDWKGFGGVLAAG